MPVETVVIIIPTYNEANIIQETVNAVFSATQSISNMDIHILVFDSASTDKTQDKVRELQSLHDHLHLQTESCKSGLGSAYLQAMNYALHVMSADIVFEFDADLSHEPRYIAPMLKQIMTCDVVVGSRYVKGGSIPNDWGWHRKLMSVLGNVIARTALTWKYHDFTSGFRATRREALLKSLPEKFLSNQYAYKLELFWLLHRNKCSIQEYPIVFVDRKKGVSKLPANSVSDSLRVLFILRYHVLQRYLNMCLVGLTGMTVQFVVYNLCRQSFLPFHAQQIAVTAAIVNNFILNSVFTFKHHTHISLSAKIKSLFIFLSYSVSYVYLQSYWLEAGLRILGAGALTENFVIMTGMILGSLLNYFIYSRIVWRV